jgi:hypothetical protein
MKWTDSQVSTLIRKIYNGNYNPLKLPKRLYLDIADYLTGGVYKGYGNTISGVEFNSPDYVMLKALKENIHLFSAAKTFNYVLDTENLIVQGNEVIPFKEFKTRAQSIFKEYNETWLETEYNTAIGQAQAARAWTDFSEDAVLKYMLTDGVEHAEVCLSMQGVTRKKDDPIWLKNAPKNHFGCLCYLDAAYDNKEKKLPSGIPEPQEGFDHNPGIVKEIFTEKHPYFTEIPRQYKAFAKKGFGLDEKKE